MSRLPAFRVVYEDGDSYVTTMAAGVTVEQARAYFIGKVFTDECDLTGKETRRTVASVEQVMV